MPKLKIDPVDDSPVPEASTMFIKMFGMIVVIASLMGISWMLFNLSKESEAQEWNWLHKDITTNFNPILSNEDVNAMFNRIKESVPIEIGTEDPGKMKVEDDEPEIEVPRDLMNPEEADEEENIGSKSDPDILSRDYHLKLATKLKTDPAFNIEDEAEPIHDFVLAMLDDSQQTNIRSEHNAGAGRQQAGMERLSMQVLSKFKSQSISDKVQSETFFFAKHLDVLSKYRGLVFSIEGRLFDLYEHKLNEPILLDNGTKITNYFEGIVCYLGKGEGRGEDKIEPRTVIFQTLELPAELKKYLNTSGVISHKDKLSSEHVGVKFTGAFLRRWMYNKEVKPFSSKNKRIFSQVACPLLLTSKVSFEGIHRIPLTDELLQQVRDSISEDPEYLETEGAYYAILALANRDDDDLKVVEEISYFDLAGMETGPAYRSQGIRIQGMIGNDYYPVVFPPNISGLRRIYRAYLLADMYNMQSKKLYLVDMIEAPTGLEPQSLIDVNARYYRNVFEAKSTSTEIRPLLIVKKLKKYKTGTEEDNWYYGLFGVIGVILLLGTISYLVLADRKERASFEQNALELQHERIRKRGGLKLKPLPNKSVGGPVDENPDKDESETKPESDS